MKNNGLFLLLIGLAVALFISTLPSTSVYAGSCFNQQQQPIPCPQNPQSKPKKPVNPQVTDTPTSTPTPTDTPTSTPAPTDTPTLTPTPTDTPTPIPPPNPFTNPFDDGILIGALVAGGLGLNSLLQNLTGASGKDAQISAINQAIDALQNLLTDLFVQLESFLDGEIPLAGAERAAEIAKLKGQISLVQNQINQLLAKLKELSGG